jgi:hypothetical protein
MPNARNNLILQLSTRWYVYTLQDLQLLDEHGNSYCQPSQRNISAAEFDAFRMPDDHESRNSESE